MKKTLLTLALMLATAAAWAQTQVTFVAGTDKGSNSTDQVADAVSKDGVTIAVTSGVLARDDNYRFYANQTVTVSSTVGNIASIEFTCTASGTTAKYGPNQLSTEDGTYAYEDKVGTWTGDQASVTFTVAAQARATQIVVTLKEEEPVTFNPASGTALEVIGETTPFTVTFADPEAVKYAQWELRDQSVLDGDGNPEYLAGSEGNVVDGVFTCTCYATTKLYEGHTYVLTIYAYASEDATHGDWDHNNIVGTYTATYTGTTPEYHYADVELESYTPQANDVFVNPYQEMSLVFTNPVKEMTAQIAAGSGVLTPCETAKTNDEGTEWKVTLPVDFLSTCVGGFAVRVIAKDADGRLVKGNAGEKEGTHFEWEYSCYLGAPDFTCTEHNTEVEKIDTIHVEFLGAGNFPAGIAPSYNTTEKVQLTKGQELIYEFDNDADIVFPDDINDVSHVALVLPADKVVTEPGNYQVIFPTMFFLLGQDFYTVNSRQMVAKITIPETAQPDQPAGSDVAFTTDPENGSTVESISRIVITFPNEQSVTNEEREPITITDEAGNDVGKNINLTFDWDLADNQLVLTCDAITAEGVYTITIPAADLLDANNTYFESPVVITLGVGRATGLTAVKHAAQSRVYNLQGQQVAQPTKGVYVVDGKKIVVK